MKNKLFRFEFTAAIYLVAVMAVAFFTMLPASARAGNAPDTGTDIQTARDEKSIHDLIMTYSRMLDSLDLEGFSRLFAREGTWSGRIDGKMITVKGPAGVLSMMQDAFGGQEYNPEKINSFHLVTNVAINVHGDRATGYARWTYFTRNPEGMPEVSMGGHYEDVYIREDGVWKFLSRSAPRDIP